MKTTSILSSALVALATVLGASLAHAQPAAPTQLTERAADAPAEDVTTWALSAGAVVSTGNTRSWTANAGTTFRLVRGRSSVGAEWAFNYGRANLVGERFSLGNALQLAHSRKRRMPPGAVEFENCLDLQVTLDPLQHLRSAGAAGDQGAHAHHASLTSPR